MRESGQSVRVGRTRAAWEVNVDERPVPRYAKTADGVSLAYYVVGEGPFDLLWLSERAFPLDMLWEEPGFVRLVRRLSRFSRTVWFDRRGRGASGGDPRDGEVDDIVD